MALSALPFPARADQCSDGAANAADMAWAIDQIAARYAYLPERHIDLAKLRKIYVAEARAACDAHAFLGTLERMLAELHDHHIEPTVNNANSPRLVPTDAEVWAGFHEGRALIEAVRPGSGLAHAGVLAGDEVRSIDGVPVVQAVARHAPRALASLDPEANDYTLRVLLAGTHNGAPALDLRPADGGERVIWLPHERVSPVEQLLTARHIGHEIASIRIENGLGNSDLVAAFDKALADMRGARGLILDLRNTPSGGNTDVAEPILGRFVTGRPGYQRVFDPAPGKSFPKDGWTRWVRSRGETVTAPLVVLCDRWTGSMGEGMTIGLDGMKRATVVGTRMAGLCGATKDFTLPASGIGISFPTERLYHLDGTPREHWVPPVVVDLAHETGDDPVLARGIATLRQKMG